MIDDLTIARTLHILALLHWIGGVTFVTLVLLPGITRHVAEADRLATFEAIEGGFSRQARISTLIAGASGFYMTARLDAWARFAEAQFWWMHAMVAIWLVFTIILFVAEPLVLHRWFHDRALADADRTFRLVLRLHRGLLTASLMTLAGAVLGAHGAL